MQGETCPKCGSQNIHIVCSKVRICRECKYRDNASKFKPIKITPLPELEVSEEELDELAEGAIRRKKKGRRYGGKYKGRGKYKEEKW